MRIKRLRGLLWVIALLALGVFALTTFVGNIFRVTSDSMLPTLRDGEYVFVRFDRSRPRRGDLVVHMQGGRAVIKRAIGLGGESVLVARDGDVFIDGVRLRRGAGSDLIPIFDDRLQDVAKHFAMGSQTLQPWRANEELGGWELDAREVEFGQSAGLLRLRQRVQDGYLDGDGERVYGRNHVGDTAIEFTFRALEEGGRLRASLVEQADTFEASFALERDGAQATLSRRGGPEVEVLEERRLHFDPQGWTHVRFENIDNVLHLSLGGEDVWSAPYERNTRHPKDTAGLGFSIGERVWVGGEGCHVVLRDLAVWRDRHYTQRGTFGIGKPTALAPDETFVLGDNSDVSLDSREWGPVARPSIRGRASWVVWPLRAIRRLRRPLP